MSTSTIELDPRSPPCSLRGTARGEPRSDGCEVTGVDRVAIPTLQPGRRARRPLDDSGPENPGASYRTLAWPQSGSSRPVSTTPSPSHPPSTATLARRRQSGHGSCPDASTAEQVCKGLLANLDLEGDDQLPKRLGHPSSLGRHVGPARTACPHPLRVRPLGARRSPAPRDLKNSQARAVRDYETADVEKLWLMLDLKAIGPMIATLFVREFFDWPQIKNLRELVSLDEWASTSYASAGSQREHQLSLRPDHPEGGIHHHLH